MYLPIVCSVDSFLAAAGMALAGCPEIYQRRAILGFMACDMLASMAGASMGVAVSPAAVLPALAVAAVVLAYARRWPLLYLVAPVLLSIDNLVMGAADAPVSLPFAALDGVWSGALAWAGFALARSAMAHWRVSGPRNFPAEMRRSPVVARPEPI